MMGHPTVAATFAPLWQQVAIFGLVLVRISAFVVACPPFAPQALQARFRGALCAALAAVMVATVPAVRLPESFILAGVLEFMLGAAMGMGVRMGAIAISFAGELLEAVAGFSFMQMVNPLSQEQAGPMRTIFQIVAGLLFFVAQGQALVIEALAESFVRVPPGAAAWQPKIGLGLVDQLSQMLQVSLRIAAPMLTGAFATLLSLAFLTKVAPQLNIWSIGFVVTCSVMLLGLIWYTPSWMEQVAALWQQRAQQMLPVWMP